MSKFGEDSAPDMHGDDSYRAATNVVIQGKSLINIFGLFLLRLYQIHYYHVLIQMPYFLILQMTT